MLKNNSSSMCKKSYTDFQKLLGLPETKEETKEPQ